MSYFRGPTGYSTSKVAKSTLLRLGESSSQPKYDINCAGAEDDVKRAHWWTTCPARCAPAPQTTCSATYASRNIRASAANNMSQKLHAITAINSCRYRTIVGLNGTMHQGSPNMAQFDFNTHMTLLYLLASPFIHNLPGRPTDPAAELPDVVPSTLSLLSLCRCALRVAVVRVRTHKNVVACGAARAKLGAPLHDNRLTKLFAKSCCAGWFECAGWHSGSNYNY